MGTDCKNIRRPGCQPRLHVIVRGMLCCRQKDVRDNYEYVWFYWQSLDHRSNIDHLQLTVAGHGTNILWIVKYNLLPISTSELYNKLMLQSIKSTFESLNFNAFLADKNIFVANSWIHAYLLVIYKEFFFPKIYNHEQWKTFIYLALLLQINITLMSHIDTTIRHTLIKTSLKCIIFMINQYVHIVKITLYKNR